MAKCPLGHLRFQGVSCRYCAYMLMGHPVKIVVTIVIIIIVIIIIIIIILNNKKIIIMFITGL